MKEMADKMTSQVLKNMQSATDLNVDLPAKPEASKSRLS